MNNQLDPDLVQAMKVHDELLAWVQQFSGSMQPYPVVTISDGYVSLGMGDVVIWDTESGFDYADESEDGDELTFDRAVQCYKRRIGDLAAWPVESNGWLYEFDTEGDTDNYVWIVSKEFWDEHHYFDDRHLGDAVAAPEGFEECQESLFKFHCDRQEAEELLLAKGFTKLKR
jgi:hypothetical protein